MDQADQKRVDVLPGGRLLSSARIAAAETWHRLMNTTA